MKRRKTKELLKEYRSDKRRKAVLESDMAYIKNQVLVKTTNYSDECCGVGKGIEAKYWSRIERLKEIDLELSVINPSIERVERVLELLRQTHPEEVELMLLRHYYKKSPFQIEEQTGWCQRSVTNKIKEVEKELEYLLA